MNDQGEKIFRKILRLCDGKPMLDALSAVTHALSIMAVASGLTRDAFVEGCGSAYDAAVKSKQPHECP